jgi:hypothetical protein
MQINSATIIGAGGTGQQLIPSLMRMLQYHPHGTTDIAVFDGDQFEDHNVARQINNTGSKADSMNVLLKEQLLAPVCVDQYMSRPRLKRLCESDCENLRLVIAAVDNDATRKMCLDVLLESGGNFLFITPGNSDASDEEKDIRGNVLWFGCINGTEIGINPALLFPNIERPSDGIPRKGSCTEDAPSTPQLIAANALAAAYTLTVVQNFLDDRMPYEASHLFFNGRTLSLTAN